MWIREAFQVHEGCVEYRATCTEVGEMHHLANGWPRTKTGGLKWKPATCMPRQFARPFLWLVTDMQLCKLGDIPEVYAIADGPLPGDPSSRVAVLSLEQFPHDDGKE